MSAFFLLSSIFVQSGYVILLCVICKRKPRVMCVRRSRSHSLTLFIYVMRLLQTHPIQRMVD